MSSRNRKKEGNHGAGNDAPLKKGTLKIDLDDDEEVVIINKSSGYPVLVDTTSERGGFLFQVPRDRLGEVIEYISKRGKGKKCSGFIRFEDEPSKVGSATEQVDATRPVNTTQQVSGPLHAGVPPQPGPPTMWQHAPAPGLYRQSSATQVGVSPQPRPPTMWQHAPAPGSYQQFGPPQPRPLTMGQMPRPYQQYPYHPPRMPGYYAPPEPAHGGWYGPTSQWQQQGGSPSEGNVSGLLEHADDPSEGPVATPPIPSATVKGKENATRADTRADANPKANPKTNSKTGPEPGKSRTAAPVAGSSRTAKSGNDKGSQGAHPKDPVINKSKGQSGKARQAAPTAPVIDEDGFQMVTSRRDKGPIPDKSNGQSNKGHKAAPPKGPVVNDGGSRKVASRKDKGKSKDRSGKGQREEDEKGLKYFDRIEAAMRKGPPPGKLDDCPFDVKGLKYSAASVCGGCKKTGHVLADCVTPGASGCIEGCPVCNTQEHELDRCQHAKSRELLFYVLVVRRSNKCPILTTRSWWRMCMKASSTPFNSNMAADDVSRLFWSLRDIGYPHTVAFAKYSVLCDDYDYAGDRECRLSRLPQDPDTCNARVVLDNVRLQNERRKGAIIQAKDDARPDLLEWVTEDDYASVLDLRDALLKSSDRQWGSGEPGPGESVELGW
ncbi:hypothetical protein LX32DRAFT_726265 [Colletotrichum zoysiae]|uniref:CCHC-type domain-containing protein n=1 Tax=Colletotrichum zoysiae TaxID=1216348 RepID=A0AAD9M7T6_9PEZI|nr:hypothetical protein LX32DRAFT_726265 [Colletotrichum zoysiae]